MFNLPFWIIRDKERRRDWTRKISEDLNKLPRLLDRAGGIWKPESDILGAEPKAPKIKSEQMDEIKPMIILDEDLETPTEKTRGPRKLILSKIK